MTSLADLKAFDIQNSEVTLWTFKGTSPKINGHWIETTDDLDHQLKAIFSNQLGQLTEAQDYTLMAQNNEGSVLSLPADETDIEAVITAIANKHRRRRISDVKTLQNARFYVVKLAHDGQFVLGIRKTDKSWKTRSAANILTAIYKDRELDVLEDEGFKIHKSFDMFYVNEDILICNKRNFEIVLAYRAAHENDFSEMKQESEFQGVFESFDVLGDFVSSNRVHLRRMSAIREKGFYKDLTFMDNLRAHFQEFGLNIQFDDAGKIVPTAETCRDILTALLDHRLRSGFSGNTYDVPDATQV
ncbi:uncharacterized protein DUF4868 [Rhizobium sp. PP-F2F-G36]|nr:uncharacterized protein DUF4868 [Rhizobium sp. PP-F2F-G36]